MRFGPFLLCAALLAAQTQPAAQDKCTVEGLVLNSVTGQPVPRALITLRTLGGPGVSPSAAAPAPAAAASDSEGKFVFANLAPGSYRISAQRDNFQYIQPSPSAPLTLGAGDRKTGVVVRLTPFGAIAGHVQNEEGDPLPNVQVNAMIYQYTSEGRQLVARSSASTNDLGDYRVFGMASGKYILRAAATVGRLTTGVNEAYVPLYYPGVTDSSGAAPVELAAGQDMRGVDFTLRRVHAVSVRGHLAKPAGAPNVVVSLSDASGMGGAVGNSAANPEGGFELRGVAPGSYTLTARISVANKMYVAERPLQIGSDDVEGVELTLAPPVDVSGVVRIEGETTLKLSQLLVMLRAPRQTGQARVNNEGTFEIRNLAPEVYRLMVYPPGDLFMKSVRCGATDVTDSGLDLTGGGSCDLTITLSANGARVEGQVQNDDSRPAQVAYVTLVAPGSGRDDLFKGAATGSDGHFAIAGIAPGSYRIYAWDYAVDRAAFYDPDFIKPFENLGQKVQVSEGDKQTVTLKPIPKPATP
jgi:hypothetical protein